MEIQLQKGNSKRNSIIGASDGFTKCQVSVSHYVLAGFFKMLISFSSSLNSTSHASSPE